MWFRMNDSDNEQYGHPQVKKKTLDGLFFSTQAETDTP